MSKNYDNWERLVRVVLRRERDRAIALRHSIDDSSISSTSSSSFDHAFSSPFQFDHHLHNSPSDFTLDHADWRTMLPLPPDKQELVWRSASLVTPFSLFFQFYSTSKQTFFLDPRTGNNCFLLGAARLTMALGDAFQDRWEIKSNTKSRFSEVAELIVDSHNFYIQCNIKTKMLSPGTSYAAYLVFAVSDKYENLHSAVSIIRNFNDKSGRDGPDEQARIVQFLSGNRRADGWLEIQLGDFDVGLQGKGEVEVQFLDTSQYRKSGLVVEGLEFRPCVTRS